MSGRISDLAVYEANPAIFYVATAHGGVWRTTNAGTTFEPQFQDQGVMSIGDVTVSQSNPDLVWVGTGESNNRQSTSWGDGVYKSTDGGKTYTNMGLRSSKHINRIAIDPRNTDVVLVAADIQQLHEHPRIGVAAQTTQPIERVRELVALIRQRFPRSQVRFFDTVCRPTKDRQTAAVDLSRQSDVVIVVGGTNSNNTRELVNTCQRYCRRVYHVQTASDLRHEWVLDAGTVGLTAGTSTPDAIIDRVEQRILEIAGELSTVS